MAGDSRAPLLAGVDGCRGGWVVASCRGMPCREAPAIALVPDFAELVRMTIWHDVVAVDIPIGLPSGANVRFCDVLAKEALPPKARSRVFMAPPREALAASDPVEFQFLHLAARGRKAGLPVWGLTRKLNDVHQIMNPKLQQRIIEFHPELTWQRLAGRALESKHKREGIAQRLEILNRDMPRPIRDDAARKLRGAGLDDVLDALSGLYAAAEAAKVEDVEGFVPNRLPPVAPPRDITGLRMEIFF